ncbi:hypothetical protein GETHLI_02670 [Geothrix limicola]|uniref:Alpha galactosidase C-terminal domain-containing protein n=1 Tax=Geothrix limicola TaxID=2927978 RepID=A0ABQ5QCA8_9BACT|nr:hypothetical protein [Geothrix limicola]GLH71765.1 hypothetical protein GETHLI_02670 [Geothrix limicola]
MWGVDAATEAGKAWYNALYAHVAAWGVDSVKVDDLSQINGAYSTAEVEAIQAALRKGGRSIALSLSPGEAPIAEANLRDLWARKNHGHQKRYRAMLAGHGCVMLRVGG